MNVNPLKSMIGTVAWIGYVVKVDHRESERTRRNRKVLVIKTRAIGDTVLLTGVLRVLKQHRPSWNIQVLVRTEAAPVLEGLPYISRIFAVNEPKGALNRLAFWLKMVRRLRAQHYDQILNFHASNRTGLVAKLLRAEVCVANHHDLKSKNFFSDLPVPDRGKVKAIIDRDLDVLRAIGVMATVDEAMPEIRLTSFELEEADRLLKQKNAGTDRIFLGIGGSRATKRWTPEHFVELIELVSQKKNASFVIASIQSDKDWIEEFQSQLAKKPGLSDRVTHFENLSLRTVAAIASRCKVYAGNDSGLKHIAVAVGLPTFTFFGPESPNEWHPYPEDTHRYAFIEQMGCRTETGKHWCPVEVCSAHEHRCMIEIKPEHVLKDILELMDGSKR